MIAEAFATFIDHYRANQWLQENCKITAAPITDESLSEAPICTVQQGAGGATIQTTQRTNTHETIILEFFGVAKRMSKVLDGKNEEIGADDIAEEIIDHFDGRQLLFSGNPGAKIILTRLEPPFMEYNDDFQVWQFTIRYQFTLQRVGQTLTD